MPKMNAACIIQCAAIDPHLFHDGGRIGGNEFRVRLDEIPSCRGLDHLLRRPSAAKHVLHSPSCGQEHEKRTAECRDGSVSFSEHHLGNARTTAASPLHGCQKPAPAPAGASELSLRLDGFGYNRTHLVQLTSTTSP